MIFEIILYYQLAYLKPQYECIRWSWTGDVYNRKVVCLVWKEKDKDREVVRPKGLEPLTNKL